METTEKFYSILEPTGIHGRHLSMYAEAVGFTREELTRGTSASRKMEEMYFPFSQYLQRRLLDIIHKASIRKMKFGGKRMTDRDKGM